MRCICAQSRAGKVKQLTGIDGERLPGAESRAAELNTR
jgi:hypothetical protein